MKKFIVLCMALCAATASLAQISFGVRAGVGLNREKFSLSGFSAGIVPGTKAGFYAGPTLTVGRGLVSFHTDITYNLEGLRLAISDAQVDLGGLTGSDPELSDEFSASGALLCHYHTLRLPLLVRIKPADGFSLLAGPYISYRLAAKTAASGDIKTALRIEGEYEELMDEIDIELRNSIRPFDMGLTFGMEYETPMGIFFELRYILGLLNRVDKNYLDADSGTATPRNKYSAVQIGMGIKF